MATVTPEVILEQHPIYLLFLKTIKYYIVPWISVPDQEREVLSLTIKELVLAIKDLRNDLQVQVKKALTVYMF